ncbi:helix-turn-helix transcriptional regulator [Chromobacterium haemolyticum]|uniref:helix-turn-helix transcriptional regulator n=1 Tax=Chromobacterium haemolyticum TaxID=394935 RepID=UPI001316492C|nr:LuxR family transcriptional regulator [Chromobacterium haemolyticum]BBH12885.1 hypothetical protein CH06BL_21330 [Chromobacterium haemolyticum]
MGNIGVNTSVLELMNELSAINLGQLALLQRELLKISDENGVKDFLQLLQGFLPGNPPLLLARIDAVTDSKDSVLPINLGWKSEWIELYWERNYYRVDPILKGKVNVPILWSRDILGVVKPTAELKCFQKACHENGMLHGVSYITEVKGGHKILISLFGKEVEEKLQIRMLLEHLLPVMAEAAARALAPSGWMAKLTAREREMFNLIVAKGYTYREAAFELGVSYGTVKSYMQNLVKRNGFNSLLHLAWCWGS